MHPSLIDVWHHGAQVMHQSNVGFAALLVRNVACLDFLLPSKCLLLLEPTLIFPFIPCKRCQCSSGFGPGEGAKLLEIHTCKGLMAILPWHATEDHFH